MHEYSIVQSLLDQCEHYAIENDATSVQKITVKIGVLSGVEIHLFETAFHTFKEGTLCSEAELIIQEQPLLIYCNECDKEHILNEMHIRCPECNSLSVKVLDGEEMYLMQLEMA
ncbi:hydrogenase maturation nickel metallochaperone HypA [Sulfurovum sp. zt1-1]|uniref:Hydrogenase maturation factor HypA n=1 Tax=Sulfurovum zhangzhouensis TaxID=3019067 RepID=A0ABT7QWD0_9BACT|nr:hydrogenase maturation nickel metallochaperone HypA [Sulfurovum zhangzhouensis]MDM5271144.1 hydrogenase maturation nickel metallochaperone HypA [Sulfurovum zhangzhouensis]